MRKLSTAIDQRIRVLIVEGVPSYPVSKQREECAAYGNGMEFTDYDVWCGDMARENDTLVVASLRLLHDMKRGLPADGPVTRLRRRIAKALKGGRVLVEGKTGAISTHSRTWVPAVRLALSFVKSGGHMDGGEAARTRARKGGKKGGAVLKARSAAQRFKHEPELLAACIAMWRSPEFRSDAARTKAVNDMLAAMNRAAMQFGSDDTARRTLGKLRKG